MVSMGKLFSIQPIICPFPGLFILLEWDLKYCFD